MKKHRTLGVIGGGFMARAILSGALSKGILSTDDILVCDPSTDCREYFAGLGIAVSADNRDAVRTCEYLLLAVKPQTFPAVADELRGEPFPVIISIMAGRTKEGIRRGTNASAIARVMPNLPCSIGVGMTAIDASELSDPARQFVLGLFLSVGKVIETEESLLNAVTAVSGSGPAYVYLFLRAFIEAAVEQGHSSTRHLREDFPWHRLPESLLTSSSPQFLPRAEQQLRHWTVSAMTALKKVLSVPFQRQPYGQMSFPNEKSNTLYGRRLFGQSGTRRLGGSSFIWPAPQRNVRRGAGNDK